ncbi:MAG: alpha/beta hydrolase-fold protein [Balneolaceae bacterium]|nr:alpha/beta hydrolase-fold protein [Balneolaceae bacterium]
MMKSYKSWKSPSLGKKMEMLIFGKEGTPVILFPSAYGSYKEWESCGAFDVLHSQIEEGFNQFFCVDAFATESFVNKSISPLARIKRFNQYQEYVIDELLPFIANENSNPFIITTGVGIGAYCALLMVLKHPQQFHKAVGISGYYDISVHMDREIDDSIYFNNPVEFVPNLHNEKLLRDIGSVDIRLLNYKNDPTKDATKRMSDVLWRKNIEHEHFIWDEETTNPWTLAPYILKDNLF